jgi:hypothetical protein
MSLGPNKPAWWMIGTILGGTVLAIYGYRRVTKHRKRQREDGKEAMPRLELRAIQNEGKQRLSRSPASVKSIGLVVHLDDGRQQVRLDPDGSDDEGEIDE